MKEKLSLSTFIIVHILAIYEDSINKYLKS